MRGDTPKSPLLFLSHAGADVEAARALKRRIEQAPEARKQGLKVWFDKDNLRAGESWQGQLEETIGRRATAFAVYIGSRGVINWVEAEVRLGLSRAIGAGRQRFPFIPILAAGAIGSEALPGFARQFHAVRNVEANADEFRKLVAAVLGHPETDLLQLEKNPFFGLKAIDETRSHLFFGRERETQALIERLSTTKLLMVTGDSGSGKSSLVRAGLVPRWRGGALAELKGLRPGEIIWHVIETRPGSNPRRALGDAVFTAAKCLGESAVDCGTYKEWVTSYDAEKVRDGLRCGLPGSRTRTLVVVDQFEELFTVATEEHRRAYIRLLLDLTASMEDSLAVVLTMRRDYYNLCSEFPELYGRLEASNRHARYLLERMRDEDLYRVITEPLRLAGVPESERDALARSVLLDVGERPGDLALVQFALTATWQHKTDYDCDLSRAYTGIGRVEGALAGAAENVYADPDILGGDAQQTQVEAIAMRLVHLGDTGGATRRIARRGEFCEARWRMLQALAEERGNRLVLISGAEGDERVEIAHEAFVSQWPRFQRWLQAAASDKRVFDELIERAARWALFDESTATKSNSGTVFNKASGKGSRKIRDRYLATGADLERFDKLDQKRREWLAPTEVAYVTASKEAQHREERQRTWLFRSVGAASILIALAAIVAWVFYLSASKQRDEVLRQQSRFLATLALDETQKGNSTLGVLLALAALPGQEVRPYVQDAEYALYDAVSKIVQTSTYSGKDAVITNAMISADRRKIVTSNASGEQVVDDVETKTAQRITIDPLSASIEAISSDGRVLAVGQNNGQIIVFDLATHGILNQLVGHDGAVLKLIWSDDHRQLVSSGADGTVRLWSVDEKRERARFRLHEGPATFLLPIAHNRALSAGRDGTVTLLDLDDRREIGVLRAKGSATIDASVNTAGTVAAIAFDGEPPIVFNFSEPAVDLIKLGSSEALRVAVTPDGKRAVTVDRTGEVTVWDTNRGLKLRQMNKDRREFPADLDVSPDGALILLAGGQGDLSLWELLSGERVANAHSDATVQWARFGAVGREVFGLSAFGQLTRWQFGDTRILDANLPGLRPMAAALSPGGAIATVLGWGGQAESIDISNASALSRLKNSSATFVSAVTAPAQPTILGRTKDPDFFSLNMKDLSEVTRFEGHQGPVNAIAFCRNGTEVISASDDGAVLLWHPEDHKPFATLLKGAPIKLMAVATRADKAVTAAIDGTITVIDLAQRQIMRRTTLSGRRINALAISEEGKRIIISTTAGELVSLDVRDEKSSQQIITKVPGTVSSLKLAPDERFGIAGLAQGELVLLDLLEGREIMRTDQHRSNVFEIAFVSNRRFVSFSSDGTARLWAIDERGLDQLSMFGGSGAPLLGGAVDVQAALIATISEEGRLIVYRMFPDLDTLIAAAKARIGDRRLSADEARRYYLNGVDK
jgi:WD40 repeat protein